MKGKYVNTVKELIEILKNYPEDTEVNHLTGNKKTGKEIRELYLIETHPIGDRDSEDIIDLSFANNENPFDY